MATHNQTLNLVQENFAYVLEADNVDVEIEGNNVKLVISGESCDLEATLNKQLEVTAINYVGKTEQGIPQLILWIVVLLLLSWLLSAIVVYLIRRCLKNIFQAVDENRAKKKQV